MKKLIYIYIKFVQKILITFLLTLTYFFVFSIVRFFMIFIPKENRNQKFQKNSFWKEADGYETDIDAAMTQS